MVFRWPRIEWHCGERCGFNVIFLRQTEWNPQSHVKIPPGSPEPVMTSWGPHLDSSRWFAPTSEVFFVPSQDDEALESASSSEWPLPDLEALESEAPSEWPSEDDASSEEASEGHESSEDDTTNKDDSDHEPSTTDPEREASIHAFIQTQETMRWQMRRNDRTQIERREEADMRESLARIAPRGLLRQT